MTAKNAQGEALELLTDPDALEEFLSGAGAGSL